MARHPSESAGYLWARVLAYLLEFTEGIEFSRGGLSDPDEPALAVRDLTGTLRAWVEIGAPDAARLHKAAKTSPRVVVYTHKDLSQLLPRWRAARIHRAGAIEVYAFERQMIEELDAHLERRIACSVSVMDRELDISIGTVTIHGRVVRHAIE